MENEGDAISPKTALWDLQSYNEHRITSQLYRKPSKIKETTINNSYTNI